MPPRLLHRRFTDSMIDSYGGLFILWDFEVWSAIACLTTIFERPSNAFCLLISPSHNNHLRFLAPRVGNTIYAMQSGNKYYDPDGYMTRWAANISVVNVSGDTVLDKRLSQGN